MLKKIHVVKKLCTAVLTFGLLGNKDKIPYLRDREDGKEGCDQLCPLSRVFLQGIEQTLLVVGKIGHILLQVHVLSRPSFSRVD